MARTALKDGKNKSKGTSTSTDDVRRRVHIGHLLAALEAHALGRLDMTSTQVRAAEILLKKTLPDLSVSDFSGPVQMSRFVIGATPEFKSSEAWIKAIKL